MQLLLFHQFNRIFWIVQHDSWKMDFLEVMFYLSWYLGTSLNLYIGQIVFLESCSVVLWHHLLAYCVIVFSPVIIGYDILDICVSYTGKLIGGYWIAHCKHCSQILFDRKWLCHFVHLLIIDDRPSLVRYDHNMKKLSRKTTSSKVYSSRMFTILVKHF